MKCHQFAVLHCVSLLLLLVSVIVCPPVTDKPPVDTTLSEQEQEDLVMQLTYDRYLKEVMSLLMSDANFSVAVINAGTNFSAKSGEIARHLDFVGHGIRTQLDEIKRKEIDRLRQIIRVQSAMKKGTNDDDDDDDNLTADDKKGINLNIADIDKHRLLAHLDHGNPNSFEIEDLSKLIKQATKDLEDIDQKRRDEFKTYEMEKELLRKKELEEMDENKRAEEEQKFKEIQKKHATHPELNHPGNEAQLQEVWEQADGLNKNDFDPRTFFFLHDSNGDGVLDESEVEALFQKELDKVYDPNAPEDDMVERYEEMNRMREHVMKEIDKDGNKLISLDEFLENSKNSEFKKEEGWDTLEKQNIYSDEELMEFQKQYEELHRQNELQPGDQLQEHPPGKIDVNSMNQGGVAHQEKPVEHQQQPIEQPVEQQQQQPVEHQQPPVQKQQ